MKNNVADDIRGVYNCKQFMYVGGFKDNMFNGQGEEIGQAYYFKGQYKNNAKRRGVLKWKIDLIEDSDEDEGKFGYQKMPGNKMINQNDKFKQNSIDNNNNNINNNRQQLLIPPVRQLSNLPKYLYKYQGQFTVSQLFTGYSLLQEPTGVYKGQFFNGLKHGKGIYIYKSQLKYDGQYKNDKKQGNGILYNCDSTIAYQGQWKQGLPHGNGASYDLNGKRADGVFKNGLNINLLATDEGDNIVGETAGSMNVQKYFVK